MRIYTLWVQGRDGAAIKKTDDGRKEVTDEHCLKTPIL